MHEDKENYLKPEELKKGYAYKVWARNFSIGVWDGKKSIIGIRHKFGSSFLDGEIHWDLDQNFGTCKPYEEICEVTCEMHLDNFYQHPNKELFNFLKELKEN